MLEYYPPAQLLEYTPCVILQFRVRLFSFRVKHCHLVSVSLSLCLSVSLSPYFSLRFVISTAPPAPFSTFSNIANPVSRLCLSLPGLAVIRRHERGDAGPPAGATRPLFVALKVWLCLVAPHGGAANQRPAKRPYAAQETRRRAECLFQTHALKFPRRAQMRCLDMWPQIRRRDDSLYSQRESIDIH